MRHRPATRHALAFAAFLLASAVASEAQPTPSAVTVVGSTNCKQNPLATVTLSAPAPAGGLAIQLSSSVPSAASVPPSVTAAAGASSATFTVTCTPVQQSTAVTLSATAGGVSRTAVLNVLAPVLNSLALKPEAGNTLLGAANLLGPAPAGGVIVTLVNSHPNLASVPVSVTVPAGVGSANFPVTNLSPVGQPTTFTITGTGLGTTRTVQYTLQPAVPSAVGLLQSGSTFVSSRTVPSGASLQGKVTLTAMAGGSGIPVQLASSNTAAVTVPASVTVAAGQTEALFTITSVPVAQTAAVTITGTASGVSKSATLTVSGVAINLFGVQPGTVIGGQKSQGRLLPTNPPPTGGLTVQLTSNNTAVALVPPTVVIPAGADLATFDIATFPLEESRSVTLTATGGGVSRTVQLVVAPEGPTALTVTPDRVRGGTSATGRLDAIASNDSFVVSLSSNNEGAATVPQSVSFGPGETTKTFSITTRPVAQSTSLIITAKTTSSAKSSPLISVSSPVTVTRSDGLTVDPPKITGISLSASSVVGGSNTAVTGTITLDGPAPATALGITLLSTNSGAAHGSSLSFPAGATSGTFSVITNQVPVDTSVTISADQAGAQRRSVSIMVRR